METKKTIRGTDSFLKHIELEARKNDMLAEIEKDPVKKDQAKKKSKRAKKLIQRVKRMAGFRVQTAEALETETPERFMDH